MLAETPVDGDATLRDIGFVDEFDTFSFCDAVVEEHAERCIGDSDVTVQNRTA